MHEATGDGAARVDVAVAMRVREADDGIRSAGGFRLLSLFNSLAEPYSARLI
jgi:hypothetical protein